MKPTINKRKCLATKDYCKSMQVCPNAALVYVADVNEIMRGRIELIEALCTGCGSCVEVCCAQAITLVD